MSERPVLYYLSRAQGATWNQVMWKRARFSYECDVAIVFKTGPVNTQAWIWGCSWCLTLLFLGIIPNGPQRPHIEEQLLSLIGCFHKGKAWRFQATLCRLSKLLAHWRNSGAVVWHACVHACILGTCSGGQFWRPVN